MLKVGQGEDQFAHGGWVCRVVQVGQHDRGRPLVGCQRGYQFAGCAGSSAELLGQVPHRAVRADAVQRGYRVHAALGGCAGA